MNTITQVVDKNSKGLAPIVRRLLNKPLLIRGRAELVVSLRKRQELMQRDERLRRFLEEHPWFGEIEGYQRQIIRMLIARQAETGQEVQARLIESFIFTAGDCLGKDVIWPILNHLLNDGGFYAEGMEIRDTDPPALAPPAIPFLEFLSHYAPAGTPAGRVEIVRLLLKATKHLEDLRAAAASEDVATEQAQQPTSTHTPST
jgi:hypothetical protein